MKFYLHFAILLCFIGCSELSDQDKYIGNWEMYNSKINKGILFSIYKQTTDNYYAKLDTAILELKFNNSEKKFITTNSNPPVEFIYTISLSKEESLTLVQSGEILGKYSRLK